MRRIDPRALLVAALMLLALGAPVHAQKNCTKGKPCGNTCIAANLTCRVGSGSATSSTPTTAPTPPADAQFAGSTQGTTYYYIGCSAWRSLAPQNLRWFRTEAEAKAAGYRASTQAGCAGPAAPVASGAAGVSAAATAPACAVASVTDGDTLVCTGGRRIRLLLVDAPELDQGPFGATARYQLEQLVTGKTLRVEADIEKQDRYGRDLAYLYLPDSRSVNEELLRAGVAIVSVYPPNVLHVDRYRVVADSARAARVGLWALDAFRCEPAEHRAGTCK